MDVKKITLVNKIEIVFSVIVIFAGVFLRWHVWQTNLSFWVDEDALICNSMDILTGKCPFWRGLAAECSPAFFMALTKPLYAIFGVNELAFRFIPFCASVLSLPVFAFLSRKVLKTPFLFLFPLVLVSINENLLFCTQYYKFYSSDFFVALLIFTAVFLLSFEKFSYKQAFWWGIVAGAACWSAYSAIFCLAGIFGVLLIKILFDFSKEKGLKFLLLAVPSFVMTCLCFFEFVVRRTNYEYLKSYWTDFGNGYFYPHGINEICDFLYYHTSLPFSELQIWGFLTIFSVGFIFMLLRYKIKAVYFISPFLVMLLSAFLGIFPFLERQTLFLNSMILLFVFKSCDFLDVGKLAKMMGVISLLLLAAVVNSLRMYDVNYLSAVLKNRYHFCLSTAREFFPYLEREYKDGDWVFSIGRDAALRVYDKNYIINYSVNVEEIENFDNFIKKVSKGERVHIYIAEYPFVGKEYLHAYDFIKKNCDIIVENHDSVGTYVLFKR